MQPGLYEATTGTPKGGRSEEYKEYEEQVGDLVEEEDRIGESADRIWLTGYGDLFEKIDSEHSEISHPEKASEWFREGAQSSIAIERFGRFRDIGISDEIIIAELVGHGGASDYHLNISARTDSPPQMDALHAGVENVFFFNSEWRGAIRDLIAYARNTGPATIRLQAFCNEDILRSIAGLAFEYPGFAPTFRFDIERIGRKLERFIGLPEWDRTSPDFDSILSSHFGEDPFNYFLAHHFGENRSVNADVMRDLGLRYSVFREGTGGPERVRVQGSAIVVSTQTIEGSIPSLISANVEEVEKVVALFMNHDENFAKTITDWINRSPGNAK